VDVNGEMVTVRVEPDARLRTTGRWTLRRDVLTLRVPAGLTRPEIDKMIGELRARVARQRKRARRQTDDTLKKRADEINQKYFGGELSYHTIRWVGNMKRRFGSFTTGGPTDGDVRLSERMRDFPAYVVDYVIAHELCHRKYPDHSPEFWEYLSRYPFAERARGFLEGISHAEGNPDSGVDYE
jgi:hypothetical protein